MDKKSTVNNLITKADAKESDYHGTGYIGDLAETLVRARARGKNVFFNFNGHKLYSADATSTDYAYQEVYGCTQEEYEKKRVLSERQYAQNRGKEFSKYNVKERMMEVYKKGLNLIYFSQKGQWYKTVDDMRAVPYSYDLDTAVEVMEILQNNVNAGDRMGLERAKGILNGIEDTDSKRYIMNIVAKFSNYGPALYTEVIKNLDLDTVHYLNKIDERNYTESCVGHGVAYHLHEEWRNSRLREDLTYKPAWRTIKDSQFIKALNKSNNLPNTIRKIDNKYEMDIANTDYNGLSSDLQYENQEAGKVAAGLFIRSLDEHLTNEFIGAEIQSEWRKRNAWAKGSDLDVPFELLPFDKKNSTLDQHFTAKSVYEEMMREKEEIICK